MDDALVKEIPAYSVGAIRLLSSTNDVMLNLKLFAPELALTFFLCALFLFDAFMPTLRKTLFPLVLILFGMALAIWSTVVVSTDVAHYFSGMIANDGFGNFFRIFFFGTAALCAVVAYGSKELEVKGRTEFGLLLLCVTFGMSLMANATHLLLLYIGIETASILSFAMAGFARNNAKGNEASIKYLVFGALSSGLMIYGFSLIYGYTGSLEYSKIGEYLVQNAGTRPLLVLFALFLVYGGIAYKISAFPMHFWTPDVYEGATTPVSTFFSVGPKAAGMAALIRFFLSACAVKSGDGAWASISGLSLQNAVAFLAAVTMIIGNLSAIGQSNVKRILAYSSIAHVGYMLMGLVAMEKTGISAILFYMVAYCLMNVGAFWVTGIVSDMKNSEDLSAFRGLGWSSPLLGVCMGVFLFSLTGIPMFSGFIGKFLLFGALLKAPGFLWLAIFGVLNSVISLYYYAKILKAMYFERDEQIQAVELLPLHCAGLVLLAIPTIVLGLFFAPLLEFAEKAVSSFL